MHRLLFAIAIVGLIVGARPAAGLSVAHTSPDERVQAAVAICHATVLGAESFRGTDGGLCTRTWLQVNDALKGTFPTTVTVVHRGGRLGEEGEVASDAPRLAIGEQRLFLLGQRADGSLFVDGGESGAPRLARTGAGRTPAAATTDPQALVLLAVARARYPTASGPDLSRLAASLRVPQAVPGLSTNASGISRRFTAGDRGEPTEYLVDADALPAGLTQAQALGAVSNAFRAWENVTSLRFRFAGLASFGTAPANVSASDGRIRIQLHDLYGYISGSSTLGVGGNSYTISGTFPNGGMGGQVNGNEFFPTTRGYLVLKHTQPALQTLSTLEEVLCHEIGHTLSLDHSSESSFEPDPVLNQVIMYFRAHDDGRGATLGSYDPPMAQQAYPTNNTPPYGYPRMMDVVTAATAPNITGINEVELRGYDLQGTNGLSVLITNQSLLNGSFGLTGSRLRYTPNAFFSATARFDPASTQYRDRVFVRITDGTNASPFFQVRVLSFNDDSFSDGVPDNWMTQYFGSANPNAGALRGPNDDFDGDGVSNRDEFRLGTDPTSAASVLRFTSGTTAGLNWLATPYEVYEVQGTTNFTNWFRVGNPITPTTTNGSFTNFPATDRLFFRVERVP